MGEPLLTVQDLSVQYGGKTALQHIDLTLAAGEALAVVGASGCGKSTLLRALAGFVRPSQWSGRIELAGHDAAQLSAEDWRRLRGPTVAMIFQDAGASFCQVRRVGEQILESLRAHRRWGRQEFWAQAEDWAARLALPLSALQAYPFELSGGMAQRVGILAAAMMSPRLLLADEPTSALDTVTQAEVARELRLFSRQAGQALILVTHHMGLASALADRVLVLRQGEAVEQGGRHEIFTAPKAAYTRSLLAAAPRWGRFG